MADTYYDRLKGEDTRPVEELCRPLSAKVMPRIAMIGLGGEISQSRAIGNQRNLQRPPNNGVKHRATKAKP